MSGVGLIAASCSKPDPRVVKQQYLESGNAHLAKREYREAIIEYRKATQIDPNLGDAHRGAAEAYSALNDPENAGPAFVRAADLAPTDDELQLKAGNLLLYARRFEEAQARGRAVLRRNPSSARALLLLGSALAGMKDLDAAFDLQRQALTLDPGQAGAYVSMGAVQLLRGNPEEALAALQHAALIDPKSAEIQLALASFYWSARQVTEAEQSLTRALTLNPNNVLANGALALVYVETDRPAEAEPFLQRAVSVANDTNSRVALSTYYLWRGRLAEATAVLEPLLANRGAFPIAKTRMALIDFTARRYDSAEKHLAEALQRVPQYVPALAVRTRLLLEKGRVPQALESAKAAVEADPKSPLGQYALGRAYLANRQGQQALDAFVETVKLDPQLTNAYVELSRLHDSRGEGDLALNRAEQAVAIRPKNLEARLQLARTLLSQPQTVPRAQEEIRQLTTSFPNSSAGHLLVGKVAVLKRDRVASKRAFERAFELDGQSIDALNALVAIDLQSRQPGQARARIESFLAAQPRSAEALVLLAQVYAMERNNAKAEETLRKVIDLHPADLDAYSALGSLYLAQNKVKEARAEFIHVTEEQPRSVGAPTLVGILSEALGERTEAERWYKKALEIDTNAPVAANNLAWIYAEQGQNLDVAVQLAQEASAQLPNRPEVTDTLGWASYKADLTATAIPLFQKSIQRDPINPTYHYHLGLTYLKQRDMARARASLQRALALNPSFVNAPEARTALASLD